MMDLRVMIVQTVFFFAIKLQLISGQGPTIILRPSSELVIREEGSWYVWCYVGDAISNVDYNIKWFSPNGSEIVNTAGRVFVEVELNWPSKKLYVTRIANDVAGNYSCTANISGHLQQKNVELAVYEDTTIEAGASQQFAVVNTDAILRCVVGGRPKPTVSMRFNGKRFNISDRYEFVEGQGLKIRGVTTADGGRYTCRMERESDGQYDERVMTLEVHYDVPSQYIGCFATMGNIERIDRMTLATCHQRCIGSSQTTFFGVQAGGLCHCSEDLRNSRVSETSCNVPCNGNNSQLCGGAVNKAVGVYRVCPAGYYGQLCNSRCDSPCTQNEYHGMSCNRNGTCAAGAAAAAAAASTVSSSFVIVLTTLGILAVGHIVVKDVRRLSM